MRWFTGNRTKLQSSCLQSEIALLQPWCLRVCLGWTNAIDIVLFFFFLVCLPWWICSGSLPWLEYIEVEQRQLLESWGTVIVKWRGYVDVCLFEISAHHAVNWVRSVSINKKLNKSYTLFIKNWVAYVYKNSFIY